MACLNQKKFSFISDSLDEKTFGLVRFKGFEAISRLYEFDIMLVSDEPDIDMDRVMSTPARLLIHTMDGEDAAVNGVLSVFEQLHQIDGWFFYRAVLVPRLWWLTLNRSHRVFIKESLDVIVSRLLKETGLAPGLDFEFRLQSPCREKEYVCQYGESHFDFISRRLEHDGLYYFFEQTARGEKLILTDSKICHTDLKLHPVLSYHPLSAQETLQKEDLVTALTCRIHPLPHDILVKDYDYERPSLAVEGRAVVDDDGRGSVYAYGEHFLTGEQGRALAEIRAQELACRKKQFHGEGCVPDLTAGGAFGLTDHFSPDCNRKLLITEVTHEGSQTGHLVAGIQKALAHLEQQVVYRNTFTAIPADTQFRPERKTPRPIISGTLHAFIDAAGSGDHAEVDAQGRYKVRLPFDIHSAHGPGKASCFIRMIQPHAGPQVKDPGRGPLPSGFHFPLRKNTEVMLSFINGDPDRPVIAGAVPNPGIHSPVSDVNQTRNIFRDHYGNEMIFDSTPGNEHVRLYSPHHNSGLMLGKSAWIHTNSDHFTYKLGPSYEVGAGSKFSAYGGYAVDVHGGFRQGVMAGLEQNLLLGASHSWNLFGYRWEYAKGAFVKKTDADAMIQATKDIVLGAGDEFCVAAGTQKDKDHIDPENRSVIRATRNGITFSLGNDLTEHKEGSGDAVWYKPDDGSGDSNDLAVWTAVTALIGAGLLTVYEDDNTAAKTAASVLSGASAAGALGLAARLNNTQMKDEKIEPATHASPAQKIWMHKDGTIGMVSTKGRASGSVDGAAGKIVIGVNEQIQRSGDAVFYNDHVTQDQLRADQRQPEPRNTKGLGDGSDIIVQKGGIDIQSGKTRPNDPPDALIQVTKNNGIEMKTHHDRAQSASVKVEKERGNIVISAVGSGSCGSIELTGKDKISMKSGDGKHIELEAQGNGEIVFKSKSVQVKARITHKNLEVLL